MYCTVHTVEEDVSLVYYVRVLYCTYGGGRRESSSLCKGCTCTVHTVEGDRSLVYYVRAVHVLYIRCRDTGV